MTKLPSHRSQEPARQTRKSGRNSRTRPAITKSFPGENSPIPHPTVQLLIHIHPHSTVRSCPTGRLPLSLLIPLLPTPPAIAPPTMTACHLLPLVLLPILLLLTSAALATQPDPVSPFPLNPRRALVSTNTTSEDKSHKAGWRVTGFVVGTVVGVAAGALFSVLFRLVLGIVRGRFREPNGAAVFSPWLRKADDLAFLESEDGVAGLEMIGRGGCGEVYRAALRSNPERLVAIKRIANLKPTDPVVEIEKEESKLLDKRMRQLRSEIQTVGHVRHRNVLPLLAHVPRPHCHYLLYEYMKNGSLQDALNGVEAGERELPWPTRLRIAQGIAVGLEYLHTQHRPKIIHRDLKPANILLDDNLDARITDFGLAKAVSDANTHMTTSNVAGTVGYIAPEYHQMLRFTDKCDVYSFGVILAVLVVGKTPSDEFFLTTEEMSMVKWMRNVFAAGDDNALEAAADRRLVGGGHEKQMLLVLKVACFCTVEDPKSRPNSKEMSSMLDQIAKEG